MASVGEEGRRNSYSHVLANLGIKIAIDRDWKEEGM